MADDPLTEELTETLTGEGGFLGSFVVDELERRGYDDVLVPRSDEFDLRVTEAVTRLYHDADPDPVVHLAATVRGSGANRKYLGEFSNDNAMMSIEVLKRGRQNGVVNFFTAGTGCSHAEGTPVPLRGDGLWDGYPEETNAPYGIAKRAMLEQQKAYRARRRR